MKRLPLLAGFVLFIALCASAAFWAMQLFKPAVRPVAAPAPAIQQETSIGAATGLFGGRKSVSAVAVASNYTLKGVVVARNPDDSIAIIATDGKPAQSVRVHAEIARGVSLKEVHRQYVLLSEGGVTKRVSLPENTQPQVSSANRIASPNPGVVPMPPLQPDGSTTPTLVPGQVPSPPPAIRLPGFPGAPNPH